jgi:hypothetical protein
MFMALNKALIWLHVITTQFWTYYENSGLIEAYIVIRYNVTAILSILLFLRVEVKHIFNIIL